MGSYLVWPARPSSRLDPICPASCPLVGGLTRAILGLVPGLGPRIQQPAATTIRLPSADFPLQPAAVLSTRSVQGPLFRSCSHYSHWRHANKGKIMLQFSSWWCFTHHFIIVVLLKRDFNKVCKDVAKMLQMVESWHYQPSSSVEFLNSDIINKRNIQRGTHFSQAASTTCMSIWIRPLHFWAHIPQQPLY